MPSVYEPRHDTAALAASLSVPERHGFAEALPRMDRPCLLFAGDADPLHDLVRDTAARLPRARFASLPGLTHIEGFWRADLVLPVATAFLAEVA